ncbi:uncharacterized protein [Phaseolus vulgaris]|uniref:uncharacterized protein n=1 Tax=Phaseolus vulgaris TaxID=3885 RepID=UPI0035C9B94B
MSISGCSDEEVLTIDRHPEGQAKVFRHNCRSKRLAVVNMVITLQQKSIIQSTPFGWLLFVREDIKLSRELLSVGLRVGGRKIDLRKSSIISHIRSFFEEGHVIVEMIYSVILKLGNDISSEDFCKLYVLLGLSEFILPTRLGLVHDGLFNLVDDLDKLDMYNCGGLVCEILVDSLCSASKWITRGNMSYIHVDGCVYLLQIWAMEHLFSYKRQMDVRVGDHELERGLRKNKVLVELCASNEELCSKFVEEAFDQIGCGITKKKPTKDEVRAMRVKVLQLMRKSEEQELLITSMEKEVNDIVELIARRNCLRRDTQSEVVEVEPLAMDCTYLKKAESSHEDVDEDKQLHVDEVQPNEEFNSHEDVHEDKQLHVDEIQPNEEVNMFPKMNGEPRKRFKSAVLKTPWTTYSRRKPKKPKN